MAAGGYKEFVAGETLDQDEINDYLMQGMLVFAGTAARGSAIGTPVEGQFSYLSDTDTVEFYDSTQWVPLSAGLGGAVVSGTTGSPTLGTVSSGGTTYNVYTFTGNGSITFSERGFADILVLGGGGGGGRTQSDHAAGGAGAGAIFNRNVVLEAGTATVTVGAGGAGATSDNNDGSQGVASVLGDYQADGGGGGCGETSLQPEQLGGAGGGGRSGVVGSGDAATLFGYGFGSQHKPFAGFDGGAGRAFPSGSFDSRSGGGGGGVGSAGTASANTAGGDGGAGLSIDITGSALFYGGGGGGAAHSGSNPGDGGSSIGGDGGVAGSAGSAASPANRGSGGGGASRASNGGNGSSGVVIVRVAV